MLEYSLLHHGDCGYDGIYDFVITTCNNTQTLSSSYYLLKNIECAYANLLKNNDWDNAFILLEYIEIIKSSVYFGDFERAKEFYNIAKRFIKKINCQCQ